MTDYSSVVKRYYRPYLQSLKDDLNALKDKDYFLYTGTQVYFGKQGSGKTISAVKHVLDIKKRFPKAIIVSNLKLTNFTPRTFSTSKELGRILNTSREGVEGLKDPSQGVSPENSPDDKVLQVVPFDPATEYLLFKSIDALSFVLTQVNNGYHGVIYLIDEIHIYFNSLDSKNIPIYIFTEISQQRKQRKCIIGTSQRFNRIALPFREQCDYAIMCKTYFNFITTQKVYEGSVEIDEDTGLPTKLSKRGGFFFQNRAIRGSYDTYQKVISGSEQYIQSVSKIKEKEALTTRQKFFGR